MNEREKAIARWELMRQDGEKKMKLILIATGLVIVPAISLIVFFLAESNYVKAIFATIGLGFIAVTVLFFGWMQLKTAFGA